MSRGLRDSHEVPGEPYSRHGTKAQFPNDLVLGGKDIAHVDVVILAGSEPIELFLLQECWVLDRVKPSSGKTQRGCGCSACPGLGPFEDLRDAMCRCKSRV